MQVQVRRRRNWLGSGSETSFVGVAGGAEGLGAGGAAPFVAVAIGAAGLGVAGTAADFSTGFAAPVPAPGAGSFEGTGAFGSSGFDILFTLRFC